MYTYCPYCKQDLPPTYTSETCSQCSETRPPAGWAKDALVHTTVDHGRYYVQKRIGAGGFGAVYEVQRTQANYRRAMKVLGQELAAQPQLQRQFIEEAEILNELDHPNIVRCHEVGILQETSQPFMLLELLEGDNLFDIIWPSEAQTPTLLSIQNLLAVGIQICDALDAAHSLGMLHRDLKPENIFVLKENSDADIKIKVIDFGIAKILGPHSGGSRTNRVIGTPEYMAPEQFQPGVLLDGRLDLYQLGAVLHFIATGYPPYDPQGSYMQIPLLQMQRTSAWGPLPSEYSKHFARFPRVDALIGQLLATKPEHRPPSARVVADLLRDMRDNPEQEQSPTDSVEQPNPTPSPPHQQPLHTLSEPLRARTLAPPRPRPNLQATAQRRAESERVHTLTRIIQAAFAILILGLGVAITLHLKKPPSDDLITASSQGSDPLTVPANPIENFRKDDDLLPPDNPLETISTPPTPPGFALIQPGTFRMGASSNDREATSDETPHDVDITRPFFIQKTEVTRSQWRRVTNLDLNNFAACGLQCPAQSVSWFDALYYLNTLSRHEGLEECYTLQGCTQSAPQTAGCAPNTASCSSPFACRRIDFSGLDCRGYRLPTEAEWEYSLRAGSPKPRYDTPDNVAWYASNSKKSIHPAKTRSPNAWGLYDMFGNVTEWVWDGFTPHTSSPTQDPLGDPHSATHTVRGGNWASPSSALRASARDGHDPTQRTHTIGFRAVRTALP